MKMKKQIKGASISIFTVIEIVVLSICMILFRDSDSFKSTTFVIFLIVFLASLIYIFSFLTYHYFIYDDTELNIRNSWAPWIDKTLKISEIEKIEVVFVYPLGRGLKIYSNNKKQVFLSNIQESKLEKFIIEIENLNKLSN